MKALSALNGLVLAAPLALPALMQGTTQGTTQDTPSGGVTGLFDSFARALSGSPESTGVFGIADVAIVLLLSFLLNLALAWAYKRTHRGVSYSQSFAQTLVLLGTTVSLVMLIVGSNIARAFTLVGALSIVRFRNAVKETRDVGFIFMTMVLGMAVGTRFYPEAVFATAFFVSLILVLFRINAFAKEVRERILKVQVPADMDTEAAFVDVFGRFLDDSALISVETVRSGALLEKIFSVTMKRGANVEALLGELRRINGNQKVTLIIGQQEIDL